MCGMCVAFVVFSVSVVWLPATAVWLLTRGEAPLVEVNERASEPSERLARTFADPSAAASEEAHVELSQVATTKVLQGEWCEGLWHMAAHGTPRHEWTRPCATPSSDEFGRLWVRNDSWIVRINECVGRDGAVAMDEQRNVFKIRDHTNLTVDGYGLFKMELTSTTSRPAWNSTLH